MRSFGRSIPRVFKDLFRFIGFICGLMALVVIVWWLTPPPAPWTNLNECELAQWSYEFTKVNSGAEDFDEFLQNGLTLDMRSGQFLLGYVKAGREDLDANVLYFSYNRLLGRISMKTLDASPAGIRRDAVSVSVCETG